MKIRKRTPIIEYIEIKVYDNVVFTLLNTLFTFVSKPITKTVLCSMMEDMMKR